MEIQCAIKGSPGTDGRQRFVLSWRDDRGRVRGQCFYAPPGPILARLRALGHRIIRRARRQRGES